MFYTIKTEIIDDKFHYHIVFFDKDSIIKEKMLGEQEIWLRASKLHVDTMK